MSLEINDVEHIAKLANLELTEEEKSRYAKELSAVLDYIKILEEVDTENVEETCQVTGLENVTREDKVESSSDATREKIIKSFPNNSGKLLKVKAVFGEK